MAMVIGTFPRKPKATANRANLFRGSEHVKNFRISCARRQLDVFRGDNDNYLKHDKLKMSLHRVAERWSAISGRHLYP